MEDGKLYSLNGYQIDNSNPGNEFDAIVDLGLYISKMTCGFIYLLEEGIPTIASYKGNNLQDFNDLIPFCQNAVDPYKLNEFKNTEEVDFFPFPSSGAENTYGYFIGIPLIDSEGLSVGAFCLMGTTCNHLDNEQKKALNILSQQIVQKVSANRKEKKAGTLPAILVQNALAENEQFLVMTSDKNGVIRSFNKGGEKILGYTAKEIVDNVSLDFFMGQDDIKVRAEALSREFSCPIEADAFTVAVERARRGLIDESEWTALKKTGECIILSVVAIALKDQNGELVGFLGIGTDVTKRKETEPELVHSRKYYRSIINAIPHPVLVKDRLHRCVLLNDACAALMKVNKGDVEGKHNDEIFPEPYAAIFYKKDEEFFNAQEKNHKEEVAFKFEMEDGKNCDFAAINYRTRFKNEDGEDFLALSIIDITERKETENKLARSEQRFRALVENSSDFITILEEDGRFRYESPSFYRVAGFKEEDMMGRYCAEFIHPEDRSRVIKTFLDAVENPEKEYADEFRHRKANGEYMTLEVIGKNRLYDESVRGMVINSRDVTERKKTEKQLALSEQRFRAFIQNSSDIMIILEMDGILRYKSPSFYKFSGYEEAQVKGRSILEFIHPDYKERSREIFIDIIKKPGASYRDEFLFKKASGEWVMIEVSGKNALDDEVVKGVVVNCRDITERKKIEEEIRIKSKMLQGITANMPVIIFRADGNGILTESIGAGLSKIGLKENEVVGKAIKDLYPELAGELENAYNGEPVTIIFKSDDVNDPWFFEFYVFPDEDNHAGGLIGFGLDISDRKIHEETQERYANTLEKVNKELDQFAYVVSHDLKAPLRAINNLSEWIEDDLGEAINENEDIKNNMLLLRKRVIRMEALINGILEYSRAGRSEIIYENVDLSELIAEVCGSIEIPETITLDIPPLPVIAANKIRLEQIFSNLLSNAVKYHDKPEGKITISYRTKSGFHEFVVADDGPGIAQQHHEKIFVIFHTLVSKDKRESTGVGLAIVKKIVEEQGGKIWVISAPGEGSKFNFSLPVKKVNNVQ